MNKIQELINIGEGYTIEFKENINNIDKDICAFANSDGGKILVGVTDAGKIIGFKINNKIKSEIQNISRNMDPPFNIEINNINKNIVIITIPSGINKPYSIKGKFYLRQGSNSQKMNRKELVEFFKKEGLIKFDNKINTNFKYPKDINKQLFNNFIKKANITNNISQKKVLTNIDLLDNNNLKNAGVLLFTNNIKKYIREATITCVLYQGLDKYKILDRKDFCEDIDTNYNKSFEYVCSKLNTEYIIEGNKRINKLELPKEALREAIINAIVHRDYFIDSNIQIGIYNNRIEITNPGGLVKGLTKKDFGVKNVYRNPLLADVLLRINLIEKIGSGIKRIRLLTKEYDLKLKFEINDDWYTIIFYRKTTQETTQEILKLIKENPKITRKELSKKLGYLTPEGVKYNLNKLKNNQKIKRKGSTKAGYWEIIK